MNNVNITITSDTIVNILNNTDSNIDITLIKGNDISKSTIESGDTYHNDSAIGVLNINKPEEILEEDPVIPEVPIESDNPDQPNADEENNSTTEDNTGEVTEEIPSDNIAEENKDEVTE